MPFCSVWLLISSPSNGDDWGMLSIASGRRAWKAFASIARIGETGLKTAALQFAR